jgi:dTDP-glucose 4,6-dehydratase
MSYTFLITGGSGFIGTNFCNFISNKHKVINIDKLSYCSVPDKFKKINSKNYKFIKGDIGNKKLIIKLFKKYKINYLVNFASESHVDRSIDNPLNFISKNINSNLELLETLRKLKDNKSLPKNFKFVHISTDEVYGSSFKEIKENGILKPNSPYSSSKASIDLLIRSYSKTFNIPYIICRPCNNFGPYQFPEKFIPTVITKIRNKKRVPIYGDGKNLREWIYVEDTCKAILKVCLKSKNNKIYNIGSSVRMKNIDLCKLIFNYIHPKKNFSEVVKKVYDRPGHDRSYSINSELLNKEIHRTKQNKKYIINKIIKTIQWYFDNEKWVENCLKNYLGKRLG